MARLLSNAIPAELTVRDKISGAHISLYYRQPTTEERIAYNAALVPGPKTGLNMAELTTAARLKYGAEILTGIEDGMFERQTEDGKIVPVSSNPESPDYFADWQKIFNEFASDLLIILAAHVFEPHMYPVSKPLKDEGKAENF